MARKYLSNRKLRAIIDDLHYNHFFRDISRHTIISRFSIPECRVFRFIPLGLYRHSGKDKTFTCLNTNEQLNSLEKKSALWSSPCTTNSNLNLTGAKVVISILVATCPDIKSSNRPVPDGCWKLGLLMNNKLILNNSHTLDARCLITDFISCPTTIGYQGYLYVWDLSTGLKLVDSLCFKDGRLECLYSDNPRSGLLAVADDKGKLLLYWGVEERQRLQTAYL